MGFDPPSLPWNSQDFSSIWAALPCSLQRADLNGPCERQQLLSQRRPWIILDRQNDPSQLLYSWIKLFINCPFGKPHTFYYYSNCWVCQTTRWFALKKTCCFSVFSWKNVKADSVYPFMTEFTETSPFQRQEEATIVCEISTKLISRWWYLREWSCCSRSCCQFSWVCLKNAISFHPNVRHMFPNLRHDFPKMLSGFHIPLLSHITKIGFSMVLTSHWYLRCLSWFS